MKNNELEWQALRPDYASYQTFFQTASQLPASLLREVQPRLYESLQWLNNADSGQFMLLKADDSTAYFDMLTDTLTQSGIKTDPVVGSYQAETNKIDWQENVQGAFSSSESITCCQWIEPEQLFGSFYYHKGEVTLSPGLLHKVNGGILVLSIKSLLAQPLMWFRLKKMVEEQRFEWLVWNDNQSLPLPIESMPLNLRVILVGDRLSLEELEFMEPELSSTALYGEYEYDMYLEDETALSQWCGFVNSLCQKYRLPSLSADAWEVLLTQAARQHEDQLILSLDLEWILRQLRYAIRFNHDTSLNAEALKKAEENRLWRHSYLLERSRDEILQDQVMIQTEGEAVGQINGLSVLDYPGYPDLIGEPTRITCVAHIGDGEFTDVERKAELGGNLHAKGMMIMQAYLNSELRLDQPQPFSTSIVFEQSYGEVDGDSASLAELCAFISTLAQQPIDQQIAVTGAVDQFGQVQPIGGVNQKIEGFFDICQQRGLTGAQGVIIPLANIRHLVLNENVQQAVKEEKFHIWPVTHVAEAITLLTRQPYYEEQCEPEQSDSHLLAVIHDRITLANNQDRPKLPWFLRLFR
ncbi:Lon protease family protein [Proteus alimentorum]|uniref:endopeptidase La n=1 Tax=Proteus alimentorum TaxID=1973495 RepID=A0ABS0IY55_9GAMM|nr:Lon protease family protein [Proteus alimentorum]MBG2875285.1 Lon protease family protein [Proteus alimentorum]MBG2880972.1 Lon protease family protein [Proteus alimentorum]